MRKIIVTGGSGFIGTNFINMFKKKYNIQNVDYNNPHNEINILDLSKLEEVFDSFNPMYVIHLAGQSLLRESLESPYVDATTNILGSLNVIELCKKYEVKKLIYASTGGARYGDYIQDRDVNELDEPKPISPYGISKHTVEHYLDFYNRTYGLDYKALCFGNVFGPFDNIQNNRIITTIIDSILSGKEVTIHGDGSQTRDYIYVEDICRIIEEFIDYEREDKIYNIGSGVSHSINDIISTIESISGKKVKVVYKKFLDGEIRNVELNCSRFKEQFNFRFTNFEEAMSRTYNHFKRKHK